MWTPFPELNELLAEVVSRAQAILDGNFVGAYLTGSFALGAGDAFSDCDFVGIVAEPLSAEEERALRELHDELPTRHGYWPHNLEGSYAPRSDLETLAALDRRWLYVDRGHRSMDWSTHCNTEDARWVLCERGITLAGPEPREFVCEVPAEMLRNKMRLLIETFLDDLFRWTTLEISWSQRYAVETFCRMLYTLETGRVTSKPAALRWAEATLAPEWRSLIRQVADDRSVPWDDPARPGSVDRTLAFADYAKLGP
jgi:predicted nucleotidyltransferase